MLPIDSGCSRVAPHEFKIDSDYNQDTPSIAGCTNGRETIRFGRANAAPWGADIHVEISIISSQGADIHIEISIISSLHRSYNQGADIHVEISIISSYQSYNRQGAEKWFWLGSLSLGDSESWKELQAQRLGPEQPGVVFGDEDLAAATAVEDPLKFHRESDGRTIHWCKNRLWDKISAYTSRGFWQELFHSNVSHKRNLPPTQ